MTELKHKTQQGNWNKNKSEKRASGKNECYMAVNIGQVKKSYSNDEI